MSTFSELTVDSSSGLGIDLYPEKTFAVSSSKHLLNNALNGTRASHDHTLKPIRHDERENSTLFSDSDVSISSTTPLPSILDMGAGSQASDGSSATSPPTSGISSKIRPNCYPNHVHIDVVPKPDHSKALPGKAGSFLQRTLLTTDGTPMLNAEELKQLLGNANSRLKSRAAINPGPFSGQRLSRAGKDKRISLEQARSRSRVNLDIFLESDVCVQGGSIQGHIQIRVRKFLKKNCPILIAGGELRLIGFENTDNDQERSIFYQCSAPLSEIAYGLERLYSSEPDDDGFAMSTEGIHLFPFMLHLTPDSERGIAKGTLNTQNGPAIRYIAVISLALKDSASGKRSIAHFYRDCSIWPRLNPSSVLAPTSRPIQVTASESLRAGGHGEVKLTASLHRLHWVAGQTCFVGLKVVNNSEKALKNVSLRLMRSTTVFRVGYKFQGAGNEPRNGSIADVLQSSTTTKEVAQSNLEVCGRGTRGHASAKGWWAGVTPAQTRSFSHHILMPLDAVSISRGNLLEVSYTLQIIINVGTILATEVQVSLPIEIINFLSIDPPPPTFIPSSMSAIHPVLPLDSVLESLSNSEDGSSDEDEDEGYGSEDESEDSGDLESYDGYDDMNAYHMMDARPVEAEDGDEDPARFADLYYTAVGSSLDNGASNGELQTSDSHSSNPKNTFAARVKEKYLQRQAAAIENNLSISTPRNRPSDISWQGSDGSLLSESKTPTFPGLSSQLPASNTKEKTSTGNDTSLAKGSQTTCSGEVADPKVDPTPRMLRDDCNYASSDRREVATRSPISGVDGLPEDQIQEPYWTQTPTASSRPEDPWHSNAREQLPRIPIGLPSDNGLEKPCLASQHSSSLSKSSAQWQDADAPGRISSPSAPPIGSVKDKIRELEAKTVVGV